jgi:3-dehydroquinate dehydratase-1
MVAGVITGGVRQSVVEKALRAGADALELRIDTFGELRTDRIVEQVKRLKRIRAVKKIPLIITIRSKKEGGERDLRDKERADVFGALMPYADYIDIEIRSAKSLKNVILSAKKAGKRVIVSYHNFSSTPGPSALGDIVKKGRKAGGDIVKIAAAVKDPDDLARLARVLLENRNLIVIAMGEKGASSRVFFPMLGSLVTYGSLTQKTAPGQMPLKTLKKQLSIYGF